MENAARRATGILQAAPAFVKPFSGASRPAHELPTFVTRRAHRLPFAVDHPIIPSESCPDCHATDASTREHTWAANVDA